MPRFFFAFLLCWTQLSAQAPIDPYRLNWGMESGLLAGGLGLNTTYFFLNRKSPALTEQQLQAQDRMSINAFDRSATYNWSRPAAKVSDWGMYVGMASPALLLLDPKIRPHGWKVALMGVQTFALTTGITNLTKVTVKRSRPFTYNPDAPIDLKLRKDARYSFFSGHTSVTTCMSFFTAKVFYDYNPGSRARIWVWAGAATLPAAVGFLRWRAGKHYWSDVLVGYATGALIGVLVPQLHKWIRQ